MDARDIKLNQAKALKTDSTKAERKTSPPSCARTLLNTAVSKSVTKQQVRWERIPPQSTKIERVMTNKKEAKTEFRRNKKNSWQWRRPNFFKRDQRQRLDTPRIKKTNTKQVRSLVLYAEFCVFDDTNEITVFYKRNYKVATTIVLRSSYFRPVNCNFDAGVESSLVPEYMVEPDWTCLLQLSKKMLLQSATNQNVEIIGTIILHVRMWERPAYASYSQPSRT